jgi:hypothetical protein
MTREWNKPFKFDNNNIIIHEQKKPFELYTNIIIITRNWNKLLKLKKNMIILKRKLKHTILNFNKYIFIIQYSPSF